MKNLLNFMQSSKLKSGLLLLFLFFLYTFICSFNYVLALSSDISNSVFRLHVIANSDSAEDQNLKYKVRDSLLAYMNSLCENINSKSEVILMVENNKEKFKKLALDVIHSEGFNYDVNINIGSFNFPTKTYGDISLPAGIYDSLRVEIGNAIGQNWWCVMFPSLCFIDINSGIVEEDSKQLLEKNLSKESFAIVSEKSNNTIKFKFKLLELFGRKSVSTAKRQNNY